MSFIMNMRWIEIIRFRDSGNQTKGASTEFSDLINDIFNMKGQADVTVYSNPVLPGDLCIQIFWDKEIVANQGSRLGISLAQALRRFGLVDHSAWVSLEKADGVSLKSKGSVTAQY